MNVISLGALCEREVILSAVDEAVNNGHWLVFCDCHLLEQWDKKVVAHLSQLISYFKGTSRANINWIYIINCH